MKKIFLLFAVLSYGVFTSCSSDDDNFQHELEGEWHAEFLTYEIGGESHTYPYNMEGGPFAGCDVEKIHLEHHNNKAKVTGYTKNEEGDCVKHEINGVWSEVAIVLDNEETRQILEFSHDQLVLKFPFTYYGATMDIVVSYTKH